MSSKRRAGGTHSRNRKARGTNRTHTPAVHAPPPPVDHAKAAQEYEELVAQYPEDREELLLEAADAWRDAGEYDRALGLYERLLDLESGGCREPDMVDAWRINALWDAGREEETRSAAAAFRKRHPKDAGAWSLVAGVFEAGDDPTTAAEWYTAGVTHALGVGTQVTADVVEDSADSFGLEELVIGRHRVRRQLGEPHDDWDDLADELHERRASPLPGRFRPLDEMHDPIRLKRLAEGGPDVLRAEIEALTEEQGEAEAVFAGPLRTCVLFWPEEEFAELLNRWPSATEAYGDEHAGHLRQVEHTLRELSNEGAAHLAVGRATVSGLKSYADTSGGSPDTPSTRSAYAAELARTGRAAAWPPPRNGPCWCGSERKYKKCCGNAALG
ncbi:SEC-C metal-binding domain-containing protein [Streptomyces sp. NPDC048504]|uniref:SEC-C metal-binding domain-containing protein n=1 Tax=Streptomyces sp. NPDC048504 TaxID=3365559 RepID=UPI00371F2B9E